MLWVDGLFYFLFGSTLCPACFINLHHESSEIRLRNSYKHRIHLQKVQSWLLSVSQGRDLGLHIFQMMLFSLFLMECQSHFLSWKNSLCLGKHNSICPQGMSLDNFNILKNVDKFSRNLLLLSNRLYVMILSVWFILQFLQEYFRECLDISE